MITDRNSLNGGSDTLVLMLHRLSLLLTFGHLLVFLVIPVSVEAGLRFSPDRKKVLNLA
jgi:hypothetical protein